jgi:hypothetical protein
MNSEPDAAGVDPSAGEPPVELVVNCYERTYREVLAAGFMSRLVDDQLHEFAVVTVLVNNVADRADALARAQQILDSDSPVTRVEFVADHLAAALRRTGLRAGQLKRLPHFTDCCLVAVTLDGPDWIVYWDSDARLERPADWISPTLSRLSRDPSLVIGNPDNWHVGLARREALVVDDEFAIGFGFSDVAFLARRSVLAAPIYRHVAPASWRYPLAHIEPIFEQRVDAWMRRTGKQRATFLGVGITHAGEVGTNYPATGLRARSRAALFRRAGRLLSAVSTHPAVTAWPKD